MIHTRNILLTTSLIFSITVETVFAFDGVDSTRVMNTARFSFSGSIGLAASYTGFSLTILPEVSKGSHTVYIGPKVSLSNSYLPGQPLAGLDTGWRFFPNGDRSRKFLFFVSLDYQFLIYKHRSHLRSNSHYNHIHEFHLGYGMRYALTEQWSLIHTIGVGRYVEYFYNAYQNTRERFGGYSNLMAFSVTRTFRR